MSSKNIFKRLSYLLFFLPVLCVILGWGTDVRGAEPLGNKEREELLKSVVKDYSNWGKMEIKGKLSTRLLPVKANVKIFMERNKALQFSFSAPFVGEAFRIDYTTDSVTIANKIKRVYTRFGTNHIDEVYPGFLSDLQSILLGRIAIMGKGDLSHRDFKNMLVYPDSVSMGYMVIPDARLQPELCSYGYSVTQDGELRSMAISMNNTDNMFATEFQREGKALDLSLALSFNNRTTTAELALDAPKNGGKKMEPFKPNSKFKRVKIGEVFRF